MARVAVFGGTFDPPHVGHLALAEWARVRLDLDRVLFVPAARPPHKRGDRVSSAAARLAMTRLAVRGNPAFEVSAIELERAGPSYTVETLLSLRSPRPAARWFLLIGADSLDEFHTWREPERILSLVTLAVAERPGTRSARADRVKTGGRVDRELSTGRPTPTLERLARRIVWLGNPGLDVSSTLVRRRARAGRSIRYLVPDAVATYVVRHRLYRAGR